MSNTYYTYYSYEEFGRGYIGYRKCPKGLTPDTDPYMGSYTDKTFKPVYKIVLSVFSSAEEARKAETLTQEFFNVLENPHFVNRSIQTGKGFYVKQHSKETKEKISLSHKGKTIPPEARAKMSLAKKGKKLSLESLQKRPKRRHSSSTRKKISLSHRGKRKSQSHKESISKSKRGQLNPMYGTSKLYSFFNEKLCIVVRDISIKEMCAKYNLKSCGLYQLKNSKVNSYKGWTMLISSQGRSEL